jgi:hypothetical protein
MRDLLLILAPIALVLYFSLDPDRIQAFPDWIGALIQ